MSRVGKRLRYTFNGGVWRHPFLTLLALTYVIWGAWNWYIGRPIHAPDGILAPDDPVQTDLPASTFAAPQGRWALTAQARYRVTARILGVERYHFDHLSSLIPEDLALGWGPMSDNRILRKMEIYQSDRFYFWRAPRELPLGRDVIVSHSANTHVIPENAAVGKQLSRLRPGQVVTLTGLLVNARRDDGAWINSSMVRTDTGAGACEVMLVQAVDPAPHVYASTIGDAAPAATVTPAATAAPLGATP
jgi:hypothetical protein